MINIVNHLIDRIAGKIPSGKKRSSKWPTFRKKYLKKFPKCKVCGSKEKLEAHHIIPFHEKPEMELDERNLIVLCERKKYGLNCHLLIGHLGNYKRSNDTVLQDTVEWSRKLRGIE